MQQYVKDIEALDACPEFVEWLLEEGHPTWEEAWAACPYGEYLLFIAALFAGPVGSPRRVPVILAACDCAELVKAAEAPGDFHARWAIEAAREFAAGNGDIRRVAHQAERAGRSASAAPSTPEGRAAGRWATAAQAAARVVFYEQSIHVAGTAAYAVTMAAECDYFWALRQGGFAAADAASETTKLKSAEIVRRYFPKPPRLK